VIWSHLFYIMKRETTLNFGPTGKSDGNDDLKPCPELGCDELVPRGARGCAVHGAQLARKEANRRASHPRMQVYKDPRWRTCRMIVFRRDNWMCQYCGTYDFMNANRLLSCDHANEGGVMAAADPFDPDICVTACNVCSGKKDGARGGKRSSNFSA
jgi:hypothetical protein